MIINEGSETSCSLMRRLDDSISIKTNSDPLLSMNKKVQAVIPVQTKHSSTISTQTKSVPTSSVKNKVTPVVNDSPISALNKIDPIADLVHSNNNSKISCNDGAVIYESVNKKLKLIKVWDGGKDIF
ncbi:unnamed protein product [Rotaria socialis]|uniref:Uncharacterized protein n=1 Tax=Rotaria socialis TaxID=392032 RepID=A0A821LBT3_9BILA|nr:unnamed protein product [Rotaria socialis]CAF4748496.1 unnamed protein product [Rotaria socialis]